MLVKVLEYLSRKFVLSVVALGCTFYLAVGDKELGGWAGALAVILGFYQGSNIAQDFIATKKPTTKDGAPQKED